MQNRNREIVKYPKVLMKKTQKFHEERKSIFIYEVHMEHDASIYSRVHFEQVRQNNVADISFLSFRIAICHNLWLHFVQPFISENIISFYKCHAMFC